MDTTKRFVTTEELTIAVAHGAVLSAASFSTDHRYSGGVYDQDGLVAQSRRESDNVWYKPVDSARFLGRRPRSRLSGTHLYAGWLHDHFGHFLLESTCRLWPLDFLQDDVGVIYHPWEHASVERTFAADYARTMLSALGIDRNRVTVVSGNCVVDKLLVPSPSFRINNGVHVEMNSIFDRIGSSIADAHRIADEGPREDEIIRRVYLSRRRLPKEAEHLANEDVVESIFARHGFAIVHPQLLPFAEQVRLASGARVMAGADGSALHLVAFMPQGSTVIIIRGRPHDVINHMALNQLRTAKVIAVDSEAAKPGEPWLGNTEAIERAIRDLDLVDM